MSPLRRFGQGPSYSTHHLVRVKWFRKGLYKAAEGPDIRPLVLLMINGSYCRRRRRLTIFESDKMKFGEVIQNQHSIHIKEGDSIISYHMTYIEIEKERELMQLYHNHP